MNSDEAQGPQTKVARLVRYTGRVQGVGFRITTASLGSGYPVVGYVKNLPDGRVEVYAEGAPEAVQEFLDALRNRWKRHIQREELTEAQASGAYTRFDIAY